MDLGYSVNRDCAVDEVDSRCHVLAALHGTLVNVDQLDYLAKRLDSFCEDEDAQFQTMAHKLELADIKDLINLTFCCQRATVITDFSDLERVGKGHCMNLNGGCMLSEEYNVMDGRKEALQLIKGGGETVTPFGVVYDNGMALEPLYNGYQFPAYPYDSCLMVLEITPERGLPEGKNPEYLYLPASEHQIERTLLRIHINAVPDARLCLGFDTLPEKVVEALSQKQFDFVSGVQTPEEYGKYMIRQSGHFEYDENQEGFYDYCGYGEQRIQEEGGQFNERGYVAYHGTPARDMAA